MPKWLKIVLIILLVLIFLAAGLAGGYLYRGCEAKKTTGSIKISSIPVGAKIFLDNKDTRKTTPATLKDIKPGKHAVRLTKKGYVDWKTTVKVVAGKEALVEAILVRAAAEKEKEEEEAPPAADTTPPPTPTQLSPPDGKAYSDTPEAVQTTLQWSEVADPSGVTYSVDLEYFQFTEWHSWQTITGLSSPSYTWTLKYETQRWRVWAVDGAGNASEKSSWWVVHIYPD